MALSGRLVLEPEPRGEELPRLRGHAVGRSPRHLVQGVTHVQQGPPRPLEIDVRDVDQPGGDQRQQDRRVAQPALRLLQVGHRGVGELPDDVVALAHELVQRRQSTARRTPPVGETRRSADERPGRRRPRGTAGRAGRAPPGGRPRPARASPTPTGPSGPAGRRSPRSGTRPSPRRRRCRGGPRGPGPRRGRSTARARDARSPPPRPGRTPTPGRPTRRTPSRTTCRPRSRVPPGPRRSAPASPVSRAPTRRGRRSGPGRRCRPGSPTPCRRRSARSAPSSG